MALIVPENRGFDESKACQVDVESSAGARIFVLRSRLVEVHRSAGKHGVKDVDVVHAVDHGMVSFDLEPDADPSRVLVIGPDLAGNLLEVIVQGSP